MSEDKEIITKVEYNEDYYDPKSTDYFEGYIITTTKQIIRVMIDTNGQCCEIPYAEWRTDPDTGTMDDEDILTLEGILVGSELAGVRHYGPSYSPPVKDGMCLSIIIETTQGNIIFTVGNDNGYYPHIALVEWDGEYYTESL